MIKPIQEKKAMPLYMQAIHEISHLIETGQFPTGSKLPSEAVLSETLGISRSTLREALGHLESYGIISRQQGVGTFVIAPNNEMLRGGIGVLEPFRNVVARANKQHEVVHRDVKFSIDSIKARNELKIKDPIKFHFVKVIESVDGKRCFYIEDYLIADLIDESQIKTYQGSMLTYITESFKPKLPYSKTKIFAVGADKTVAKNLQISKGHPVLHLIENYFSPIGEPLGIGYLYMVTDFFYYFITRRMKQSA